VAQAITATTPLEVLTPPRPLEELSGRIGNLAPTALNTIDELSGQIGKLAPTPLNEYVRDFWQRSALFLDILRQRGNQREEMPAAISALLRSRPSLGGWSVMETLGFCAAGLAEIAKRVNQPTIRHLPQFWESLVRLQIRIDNLFTDLVGAVDDPCRG